MMVSEDFKSESLRQKQLLPLEGKIILTQQRIREWYDHWNGQVYVLFSGGKDSTVLKHLVETTSGVYDVPNVFVNTGLEYPEIQRFVRDCKQRGDNVEIVRPEMRFDEVIKTYGYPVASKEIARKVHYAKKGSDCAQKYIDGSMKDKDGNPSRYAVSKRWLPLMKAPFEVSAYCCDVMKKKPGSDYGKRNGRKSIDGTMAEESEIRKQGYLRTGCNAFNSKKPKSKPMSFWTEQDVLEYIVKFNLPYASVYGEIEQDENGKWHTTGVDRTGCMFCMFGCHLEKEPNRFQRMKESHPKQYDYCMKSVEDGGLGIGEVLDYIGVKRE